MLTRRLFASGLLAALAAPAIIRPGVLMPVKRLPAAGLEIGDPIIAAFDFGLRPSMGLYYVSATHTIGVIC